MPKKKSVYEIKDDHLHKRVGVELKKREKLLKAEAKQRKATAEKKERAVERAKRKHAAITPGVDRRRRADNPRTGQRYVSAEAKEKILDFIGPQSVTAKQVATATGLSLTLVHQVMKHHPSIFVDKKATVAPREVDHNGREAAGPRPVRYMLGKVALRQYEARRAEGRLNHLDSLVSKGLLTPETAKEAMRLSRTEPSEAPVGPSFADARDQDHGLVYRAESQPALFPEPDGSVLQ